MAMISSASRRDALEAESRRDDAFVHGATFGERHLLAVVGDRDAERARVFERRAHELRSRDRPAVVAHGDRAGADHLAELRERLAFLADGHRADGVNARRPRAQRLPDDEADGGLVVGHRIGVRHRADGGEPAGRRGPRAGRDRLDILAPRLAQVTVHVDEARRDDVPRAVDHLEAAVAPNVA